MAAIEQSFSWDGFIRTGIDPDRLLRGAAEIGYAGVELVEPELWPRIRAHGLRIVSITGHKLTPIGLNRRDAFPALQAEISTNLRLAAQWDIPYVLCFSGNRYDINADAAAEITAEHLRALAPLAQDLGVTLVLELLNSKVAGRDYQADHSSWGIRVCQMVESPRVRLLYDIFHMQIMEGDIINTIRSGHTCFGHYHTAGNPGRHELDAEQELNYPPIIRAISASGHEGYIGHEFMPKADALTALKGAFDVVQAALA